MEKLKKIVLIIILLIAIAALSGCTLGNREWGIDTKQSFDEAYIYTLDGKLAVHGLIQTWRDFDESDVIQITIDGKTYLTHYMNVLLIRNDRQH